jgi:uncharacterized protein (DUF983 family)
MHDSGDKIDPDANYLVADGPLKDAFVTILSVEEDRKRVRALVSHKDWVTPPIWLDASMLKKMSRNWSPASWLTRVGAVAMAVLLFVFEVTKSQIALAAALILFAIFMIAFIRYGIISRRIKSCPICGTRLDPDTWSYCGHCRWERPMPHFLPAETRAPRQITEHVAAPKYSRLLRKKDWFYERTRCPRCGSSKWKRSFLPPRWGGRFTCRDCGRLWWPEHPHVIGCKFPAFIFLWCAGLFLASALLVILTGINPSWVAFLWIGSFTLVFITYLRNQT